MDIHEVFASFFTGNDREVAKKLSERLVEGNVAIPLSDFPKSERIRLKGKYENREDKPFVVFNDRIYLQRYFRYETTIVEKIKEIIAHSPTLKIDEASKKRIKNFLNDNFEKTNDINWQKIAVILGIVSHFLIITGGPGTGKTTTVAKIIALLLSIDNNLRIALSAPTGKAAARLNEAIRNQKNLKAPEEVLEKLQTIEAKTIHRLLGYGRNFSFRYNEVNRLPYDVIIVDESSMIDVALMSKLLSAIPQGAKVILIGDKDQLASVEAGSVFGDLCRSEKGNENKFPDNLLKLLKEFYGSNLPENQLKTQSEKTLTGRIVHLKKSYRFDSSKGIGKLSSAIIKGEMPDELIKEFSNGNDPNVEIHTSFDEIKDYLALYEEYINESDIEKALEKLGKIKILCAIKNGTAGVNYFNQLVEKYLQERKLIKPTHSSFFYNNLPVMMTENDYANMVFNGDVGLVRTNEEGKLRVYFPSESGEIKNFDPYKLQSGLTKVYAMTIHKSQGSEFVNVIVVLPEDSEINLLTRELLYTAVTRAKKWVAIIAPHNVIKNTVKREVMRSSGIEDRL
jgi:exodeoxyribonuclease V alpha subunit